MERRVRVGLIGSQFVSTIHAEALTQCAAAEIVAAASPTKSHVEAFAERFEIPRRFTDYREMLALSDIDLVVIGAPNDSHCPMTLDTAAAGTPVTPLLFVWP
jgi:myo-inositol 2-dehydrogenase / D-chiro-inositol 1-dehydrogenase